MFENEIELEANTVAFVLYDFNRGCLEQILDSCQRVLKPLTRNYIWQRDQFSLHSSTKESAPWNGTNFDSFLWGVVSYGDCVDDEWFIVSLLWKLTETFPSLVIQVWDDDGEFLLIETAYALPKWIKPDTASNRVWIKQGAVHIIPQAFSEDMELTIEQAIEVLGSSVNTKARTEVQEIIKKRLGAFPEDTSITQHWAKCLLPLQAAYVLSLRPEITSKAIEQFVSLDKMEKQSAIKKQYIKDQSYVMTMVKFHRCSYAQLMQLELDSLGPLQSTNSPSLDHSKATELGMKLNYALEYFLWTCLDCPKSSNQVSIELKSVLKSAMEDEVTIEEFTRGHPLFAEDDDDWLTNQTDLENELLKREKEQKNENHSMEELDPNSVVDSFSRFVETVSSHEGAEIPNDVQFNTRRFMHELRNVLGDEFAHELYKLQIETSESDLEDEIHSNEEVELSSVDSDDDSEFDEVYDQTLKLELSKSKMRESFVNKEKGSEGSLHEVDLDLNLVQNMIQSHEEEQGQPGPVGNLAGMMNLKLPHEQTAQQSSNEESSK
eukprot:g8397.t1